MNIAENTLLLERHFLVKNKKKMPETRYIRVSLELELINVQIINTLNPLCTVEHFYSSEISIKTFLSGYYSLDGLVNETITNFRKRNK